MEATSSIVMTPSTMVINEHKKTWMCPNHPDNEMTAYCQDHDVYLCQYCSFSELHQDCKQRVLVEIRNDILHNRKAREKKVSEVKEFYVMQVEELKLVKDTIRGQMEHKINIFKTLLAEIEKSMQKHYDNINKEVELKLAELISFPNMCEQYLCTIATLAKPVPPSNSLTLDNFDRFCRKFDDQIKEIQDPVQRLHDEKERIKSRSVEFVNDVSETEPQLKTIRDWILLSSSLQDKEGINRLMSTECGPEERVMNTRECYELFVRVVARFNFSNAPSDTVTKGVFSAYEFLDEDSINKRVAFEAVYEGLKGIKSTIKIGPSVSTEA